MFHWKRWYQSVLLRAEFAENQLDVVRKQCDAKAAENVRLRAELAALRKPKPTALGACPIDFSKHRPDCPLSWRFTAKAEAQHAATLRIGDWLGQGWTLEAMREYGFIEPKE